MLANLPVRRSSSARALFLATGLLTAAILWWCKDFGSTHAASRLAPIFVYLFTALDYPATVCALLVVVIAAFVPYNYSFRGLLSWIADYTWPLAGVVCVVLSIGTLLVYLNYPLTHDEFAPYFQSQVFAAGHVAGKFPPGVVDWVVPTLYQNQFFFVSHLTGRIVSGYWPGFALLLTPFTFVGIPWACNPVISALTLPVMRQLALRIFGDRETAGLTVLLTLASPVFFGDGISYYSMSAHLLANSVFALLLLDPTPRRAIVAGLVGSIALTLHNPVPHVLFAVPWILGIARRRDAARLIGCLLVGYLPLCLLLGLGWAVFMGRVAHDGIAATTQPVASSGTLERALSAFSFPDETIMLARWIGVVKVWVWAVPGMVLLTLAGAWKCRHNRHCRLFVASAVVTLLGYVLVPVDQGHGWGYRYFHSAWMVLPLLAAGAFARVPSESQQGQREDTDARTYLVACALLTLPLGWGLRAVQIREFIAAQMTSLRPPAYSGTERRVVIMGPAARLAPLRDDPWLRGDAIYLLSHGPAADVAMMRANFPNLHPVFTDAQGTVWSAAPVLSSPGS